MLRAVLALAIGALSLAACERQQGQSETGAPAKPAESPGGWTAAQSKEILDKTETLRLAPDTSHWTAGRARGRWRS